MENKNDFAPNLDAKEKKKQSLFGKTQVPTANIAKGEKRKKGGKRARQQQKPRDIFMKKEERQMDEAGSAFLYSNWFMVEGERKSKGKLKKVEKEMMRKEKSIILYGWKSEDIMTLLCSISADMNVTVNVQGHETSFVCLTLHLKPYGCSSHIYCSASGCLGNSSMELKKRGDPHLWHGHSGSLLGQQNEVQKKCSEFQ